MVDVGSLVLLKLKQVPTSLLSVWYLGELVEDSENGLVLKDTAKIIEGYGGEKGNTPIYIVSGDICTTEGLLYVNEEAVEGVNRQVTEDDSIYKLYQQALVNYRAQRAGIALKSNGIKESVQVLSNEGAQ